MCFLDFLPNYSIQYFEGAQRNGVQHSDPFGNHITQLAAPDIQIVVKGDERKNILRKKFPPPKLMVAD